MSISAIEKKHGTGLTMVMTETWKPKVEEEALAKEQMIEVQLRSLMGTEPEQMLWTRIVTKKWVDAVGMRIIIVKDEDERLCPVISEGPTSKGERELWEIMDGTQRNRWMRERYMVAGEIVDTIETEDVEVMMERVADQGIVTMELKEMKGEYGIYYKLLYV